jgi:hypothetical protein
MKLHENEARNGLLPEQNCHAERSEASGHRMRATSHYARNPDPSPMAQDDVICREVESELCNFIQVLYPRGAKLNNLRQMACQCRCNQYWQAFFFYVPGLYVKLTLH